MENMVIGIIINVIVFIILLYDLKTTKYISYEYVHKVRTENGWETVPYSWAERDELWEREKLPILVYVVLILFIGLPYVGIMAYIIAYMVYVAWRPYGYYYKYSIFHQKLVNIGNKIIKALCMKI